MYEVARQLLTMASLARALAETEATTALLVDRDDDTRSMYGSYLRLAAFDVLEASDGREALAKAVTHPPGIIVTETRLPGINGFDLCRLLRDDIATRSIPIIIVTADAFAADLARAREVGANRVLVKPCLPDVLVAEMRQVLVHGAELRQRSVEARNRAEERLGRSHDLLERAAGRGATLARRHQRGRTETPSLDPPALVCPQCDQPLTYQYSHIGGVSARHSEQWDYYLCAAGCGTFQYRQRTRKLRKV